MAHTPGPWRLSAPQTVRGADGRLVTRTNWHNGPDNALLIAAAPDMLDALRLMVDVALAFAPYAAADQIALARAVIKKAEQG